MINLKASLLATGMIAALAAAPACAQVVNLLPAPSTSDAALHGAGASSIQNILVRDMNCIGYTTAAAPQLAKSSSATSFSTISPGIFAGSPTHDCSVKANAIQPNFMGEYVSTGSGFGLQIWRQFQNIFVGAPVNAQAGVYNPFGQTSAWNNVQFAYSDAPIAVSDLTAYNNGGSGFTSAASQAGPAISFPMFVLPVAIAYDAVYGTTAKGHVMVFNALGKGINGAFAINMTKAVYCGMFNGTITNWNDPAITALNGPRHTPLFDPTNDTATRWAADGAPVRLVGRLDKSGTTDVFTRHLTAVCNATNGFTGTNNYMQHAQSLPYNAATNGNLDFTPVRADVSYKPSSPASKFAGTTNMVSGDYYTVNSSNVGVIANVAAGTPTSSPVGSVGSGLYIVADGGGKVAAALVLAPDYPLHGVLLNGKVGYISADFIQPSVDAPGGLNAASLQIGSGTTYATPTVLNANHAFTQLPPETGTSAAGVFTPGSDTRQVDLPGGGMGNATRANPLAWAEVAYADPSNTLANPAVGYPITGTTQFAGYTCYTAANRQQMDSMLALILGQVGTDSQGTAIAKTLFGGTSATTGVGIDPQSNIGVVPVAWEKAITNTFLINSTTAASGNPGALNLWIQSAFLPKKAIGTPGTPTYKPAVPTAANSACTGLAGA